MSKSFSRIAAGAVALAFVAGTASAQLEYYAITTDGNLHHVNAGVDTIVGNTGLNNSINSLALNWQPRGGDGSYWQSAGIPSNSIPPTGTTGMIDVGTAMTTSVYSLSASSASLPLGGGIAFGADGSTWQIASNFLGGSTLFNHDSAGNLISQVNVNISNAVGALHMRSDGAVIVGDNTGKIYTIDGVSGNIQSVNQTGLDGLTEFSTGVRVSDSLFSGTPLQFNSYQDVVYAVTNKNGVATIFRLNVFNGIIDQLETFDVSGSGAIWGLQVVPSPASAGLLGLGGLVAIRRRRR